MRTGEQYQTHQRKGHPPLRLLICAAQQVEQVPKHAPRDLLFQPFQRLLYAVLGRLQSGRSKSFDRAAAQGYKTIKEL